MPVCTQRFAVSNEGFIDILQIGRNDADGYFYYVMELADDASRFPGGVTPLRGPSSASPKHLPEEESAHGVEPGTRVTRPSEGSSAIDPATYVPLTLSKALLQRGRLPVSDCLELGLIRNCFFGARMYSALRG